MVASHVDHEEAPHQAAEADLAPVDSRGTKGGGLGSLSPAGILGKRPWTGSLPTLRTCSCPQPWLSVRMAPGLLGD